ncbi:hypothetical protein TorRG33x02_061440 [Trema orientale]|uniref:Uncharacterized protein n=1 Tax=Trema orientale TaxID=63057 RepID=A0A2P5FJU7_TREOI|nr:hypothetical protein TorRG33x02_061440 [Trema orientale]
MVIINRVERLVGSGIDPLADQLLAKVPVAEKAVEAENEIFLVGGDVAALDGRAEVVHPAEAAALPASHQPGPLRQRPPPPFPFFPYEPRQHLVLLRRPRPPLYPHLATTGRRFATTSGTTDV